MTPKPPKRKPLGPKPPRSPETRRALAAVTDARIERAREAWRRAAPFGAEGMLDARAAEEKPA